jgi:surface polysaccharide O-acyltransferase-like enzyme
VLLLGIWVINPIQVYVEFLDKGLIETGYVRFWLESYARGEEFPNRSLPTWDHLWFLLYLLVYALGLALLFKLVKRVRAWEPPLALLMVAPCVWLCLTNVLIQEVWPVTMALFDDWANHLRWAGVFGAGVLCAHKRQFWEYVQKHRRQFLALTLLGLAAQLGNGVYWRSGEQHPFWDGIVFGIIDGVYGWTVVLTLIGYAAGMLDQRSRALTYLTDAILPVYVVHQPIMLVAAYLMFPLSLPVFAEALLLVLVTAFGSLAVYEVLVRRWTLPRLLFGLKIAAPGTQLAVRA